MAFPVRLFRPGTVAYEIAWRRQEELAHLVRQGGEEALLLLQHDPVFTLGRRATRQHVLQPQEELARRGAQLLETDRGGDVTFHGPGQLVGYPILNLRRRGLGPIEYVRRLETMLMDALAHLGLESWRVAGRPGVWTYGGKVAAIGVRVRGGVTTHGFSLNIDNDLSWYENIVPCGLHDARVTSLQAELGDTPDVRLVEQAVVTAFADVFQSVVCEGAAGPRREAAVSLGR